VPISSPRKRFQLAFPIDSGAGHRWMSILAALLQSVDVPGGNLHPHDVELLERSLISGLLVSQVHSYTDQLTTDPNHRGPRSAGASGG
jgi:hypothetical protein